MPAKRIDPRYVVPGLSRGLTMLQQFTRANPTLTLSELAAALGLTRSAAYRLAYTLEKDDFITRDDEGKRYRLTSRVLTLGFDFLHAQPIADLVRPFLRRLSYKNSAAAHVAILEGWEAVYLARELPDATLVSNLAIGARLPAHLTASGRALLAYLDEDRLHQVFVLARRKCRILPPASFATFREQAREDRRTGYVYHSSVLHQGVASLAAVVRDHQGAAVAAITLIGPPHLIEKSGGEKALKADVLEAAATVSRKLGYRG